MAWVQQDGQGFLDGWQALGDCSHLLCALASLILKTPPKVQTHPASPVCGNRSSRLHSSCCAIKSSALQAFLIQFIYIPLTTPRNPEGDSQGSCCACLLFTFVRRGGRLGGVQLASSLRLMKWIMRVVVIYFCSSLGKNERQGERRERK